MNDIETFEESTPQPINTPSLENAKQINTEGLEDEDFASTPVPLQKVKKPLSEARKKGLAKANQTRKRNARMRKEARDDENAKRYLDKLAREEEAFAREENVKQNVTKKTQSVTQSVHESSDSDTEETQSDHEPIAPVKKMRRSKRSKKRKKTRSVRPPSISESETESDSSDDDERIERSEKKLYKEIDYSYKAPEPYKLNFA